MNARRHVAPFLAMASIISAAEPVTACPACNINNYLDDSVRSSHDIFVGRVIRQIDEHTAEVEVVRRLRTWYKVGSKVKTKMFHASKDIGKQFIFSDPTSWPPTFEVLPLEFEDEVLFLIQEKPSIANTLEAIRRVQGVSRRTQGIGLGYVWNHHEQAVGPIIDRLEALMCKVFSSGDVSFGEHRLGQLLKALFLKDSIRAKNFSVAWIDGLGRQTLKKVDWSSIPYRASSRGEFLRNMLIQGHRHGRLSAILFDRVCEILPTLSGVIQADVVFAMVLSNVDNPDEIHQILRNTDSGDMLALGLFFAGNHQASQWQHRVALGFWEKALSFAEREELKDAIGRRLEDSERFGRR